MVLLLLKFDNKRVVLYRLVYVGLEGFDYDILEPFSSGRLLFEAIEPIIFNHIHNAFWILSPGKLKDFYADLFCHI